MNIESLFPIPLWIIVIVLAISIITTFILFIFNCVTEHPRKRFFTVPLNLLTLSLVISLIVWMAFASNAREIDYTETVEVKIVTFPDGKAKQMFYAGGVNHNANQIFGAIVPEDCMVKRIVYKKTYHGIYFTERRPWLHDDYTIEKRAK